MFRKSNKRVMQSRMYLHKRQGGWLMPMAAFIVVVMGLLAAGLSRVTSTTAVGSAQELITLQTFFAAESGAQLGMNRLFFSASSTVTRNTATAACAAVNGQTINYSVNGLRNCNAALSCQVQVDGGDTTSFYQISSVAQCGASPVYAQRTVEVSAFLQ